MKKKEIIEYIISGISYLALLIYAILKKNRGVIISLVIISILLAIIFIVFPIITSASIKNRRKKVEKLKQKDNKTIEDELYIFCYQDKSYEQIKEIIKREKIKNISNIIPYIANEKPIISYTYNGFEVTAELENQLIKYKIHTSTKYRYFGKEPIFQNSIAEVSVFEYSIIDDLIYDFVLKMKDINKEIDLFINNNPIDTRLNGRTLKKTDLYINHLKREGTLVIVLSIILMFIFLVIFFVGLFDEKSKNENIISYYTSLIVTLLFVLLFVVCIIIGGRNRIRYLYFQKDIKGFFTSKEEGIPEKVRLVCESYRSNYASLYGVEVWINKCKYILPFSQSITKNYLKRKLFKNECKKQCLKLEYLTNSKVVISGEAPVEKLINEYLKYKF